MTEDISWAPLCGNGSQDNLFWSYQLSVNSSSPDLTRCFQLTVLVWLPCFWLWLACGLSWLHLRSRPTMHTWSTSSAFNKLKVLLCITQAVLTSVDLWLSISELRSGQVVPPVNFLAPCIFVISMVLAAVWTHYEYRKGVHSGGTLFLYWLLLLVCGIVPLRSYIIQYQNTGRVQDKGRLGTFCGYYALVIVQFILHLFPDLSARTESHCKFYIGTEKQPLLYENMKYGDESQQFLFHEDKDSKAIAKGKFLQKQAKKKKVPTATLR